MNARNVAIAVGVVVLVVALWMFLKFRAVQQAAVKWEGKVDEIASEKIEKQGESFQVELTSRIDAPIDAVFDSFEHPEKSQGMVPEIQVAKVLSGDDKKKTVEFHIVALDQPQVLTVELTYDQAQKRIGVKTVEGLTDIDGAYQLVASPDGKRTLVVYKAKQTVRLPLPDGILQGAIKEQFVNLMRAIKKDLGQQGKLVARAGLELRLAA